MKDGEPVLQVPDRDIDVRVVIHFYEKEKASIDLEVGESGPASNLGEFCLFTYFVFHQLATLPKVKADLLAALFLNFTPLTMQGFASNSSADNLKIVPYPGHHGGKLLFARYALNQENHRCVFRTKGFGWLSRDLSYYSSTATIVFLRHLAIQHARDHLYLTKLMEACQICAMFYADGKLTKRNQGDLALMVVKILVHGLPPQQ